MPGPSSIKIAKPKDTKGSIRRFLASIKRWRVALIAVCILAIISTALTIFGPKILGNMTTSAITSITQSGAIDWEPIINSAITLIILYVSSAAISYIQEFILAYASAKYTNVLRSEVLDKISRLPMSYFDKVQFGDTLSRMTNDVDTIATTLRNSLTEIISSITMLIGILIMMFTISVPLSLIAIVSVPISLVVVGKVMGRAQKYFRRQREYLGTVNSTVEEDYTGQQIIKVNNHRAKSLESFSRENESLYESSWKAQFFGSLAFPITHVFTNLGYVAICIVGGYLSISGRISIGDVQAFIQYVNQFNRPITQVAQIVATVEQALAAAERIFDFLDEPEQALDPESPIKPAEVSGAVDFDKVNFSYVKGQPVIKNFSAHIEPGQQVAIVGPTGAGKTTIVNLLMRFYNPDSGTISIDGVPTKDMLRADVRNLFGMVLQDTWLFSGSITENLKYGKPSATLHDVKAAARLAGVDHFIESLPRGYQTIIDEDSDNISAGEKQLLTITRAIVADPPMIILDEATSNVDTRTEELIQRAFDKLTHGRTTFVIAHRLSTIRNADLILVMKDGNIVEQGTHDTLLKKNGFYAELYNSQFEDV